MDAALDDNVIPECQPTAAPKALWAMFVSPLATLDRLRQRPRSLLPLFVAALYATGVNYYMVNRIGLARLVTVAAKSAATIDPDAMVQNALAHQAQMIAFQSIFCFLGVFAQVLFVALVLWLLVLLAGGDSKFRNVLAVAAHVTFFTTIVKYSMLAISLTLNNDPDTFNPINPLATNLGFFFHASSRAASHLLSTVDLITLATLFLLVAGLTKVCDRLSRTAASLVVLVPWGIYVAGSAWFLPS